MEEGEAKGREGASIDFPTAENEWEIREREIADSRARARAWKGRIKE